MLVRLFLSDDSLPAEPVAAHFTGEEIAALLAADLVRVDSTGGGAAWLATARLTPVRSGDREWWIAADSGFGSHEAGPPSDLVFNGHNPLTRQFLLLMPSVGGRVLDLCSGTGIDAMACDPATSTVIAVDVAPRATHFAAFNVWLNGADHVKPLQGDLYAPAEGRQFDWVIAHPPYVPTLRDVAVYRDGGEMGDAVLQRIVEGLPAHLGVGGSFFILAIGLDGTEGRYEDRVRSWMGAAGREFDLVFGIVDFKPVEQYARFLVDRAHGGQPGDLDRWTEIFSSHGVKASVYGALVGRRTAPGSGECQTRRVALAPEGKAGSFEWMLRWFEWCRQPGLRERLLASRPKLAPAVKVHVTYSVSDARFLAEAYRLTNPDAPFAADMETDGWVMTLLSGFDGTRTPAEVVAAAHPGVLPEDLKEDHLVEVVRAFAERRALVLDGPEAPGR